MMKIILKRILCLFKQVGWCPLGSKKNQIQM
jgi:hypothetical protein